VIARRRDDRTTDAVCLSGHHEEQSDVAVFHGEIAAGEDALAMTEGD
jgi:hypothetical protein